jgi:hypothetical protein
MLSNRDRRTLLDKMLALLGIAAIAEPCYFVADAYYAARKIVIGLLKDNNHLVTRVKSNAVAYTAHRQCGPRKRGRPRVYGRKVKLSSLLQDPKGREQAKSPVYGERQVVIHYKVGDLLWRPAGRLVRFVAVIHPTRGSCLLMCTDTSLAAIEIIRLHQLAQVFQEGWVFLDQGWTTPAWPANRSGQRARSRQVFQPPADRAACDPGCPGRGGNSAESGRLGLGRREQAARPFVQVLTDRREPFPNR